MRKKFLFQMLLLLVFCSVDAFAATQGFKWESGGESFMKSAQILSFIIGFIAIIVLGCSFMFGSREFFHKMLPVFGGLAIIGSAGAILTTFGVQKSAGLIFM